MTTRCRQIAAALALVLTIAVTDVAAQFVTVVSAQGDANQTRWQLQQVLRQYPPHLSEVIRLDPSLLTNETFMTPYPGLTALLKEHPEILRSPSFYVGDSTFNQRVNNQRGNVPDWDEIAAGVALFSVFAVLVSLLTWIIRTIVDHRRWLRVSKIQSEVHSKLLDRFTANQDLLAYIETPAGRRFLESAPIMIDGPRAMSAPVSRILFSVQIGVVLALAGIGLLYVVRDIAVEAAQPLSVLGTLALAVGAGFVLSALIAYVLSQRLGLLNQPPVNTTIDSPGASSPHA